jgi:hypothetical protein
MSRPTTILAMVQTLVIIVGFFALGAVLKLCGYPYVLGVRWNPLAVFLRERGLWLLFLPIFWVLFAVSAQRIDTGFLSYRFAWIIGISIAGIIIALFLDAAAFPYTVPIIIRLR